MLTEEKIIDESKQGQPVLLDTNHAEVKRKLYLESYGCAMNFADSEVVASILVKDGFATTNVIADADVIFMNTCAIRDNAETRVRTRLQDLKKLKKQNPSLVIGILGCMAERLKSKLLEEEKLVDIVVGPDAYRDLPNLIEQVDSGQRAVNVLLSREETYADISPVRLSSNGVTAFVSITRGCDNMCAFCVVPFTRGRERSRDPESIVLEATDLFEKGYREVTLLGQNVDSYLWTGGGLKKDNPTKEELLNSTSFAQLLEKVALINPLLRVRFSTSHPKDMTDEVLHMIAKYENICNYIHLPVQSGNSAMLHQMNRGYTREWYKERITKIRELIPDCGISTDTISGFCGETDEQHADTISLMEWVVFDFAYMFKYSERPGTLAARKMKDDISEEVKQQRLAEIVALQQRLSEIKTKAGVGKTHKVLIEALSKKSKEHFSGRNQQNTTVVFPKENYSIGDYVNVLATDCTSATLIGHVV
ncbi:MAG: tRNA (N6-isopentenyl adenosine(37)-C2)-methylthiotransferase MiaB [Bacteroidetes bacterium]|nr:tRNA (N6-isopentenyl adenosine(37)-C2)-methylthiotransferase MiaB [Bacteroidota bacterium]MBK9672535.1 tRNA (N6-isopentenyl adenosine(37)-C2)-methylthiotransferase MiaB [Bacteroidota bacterium]MBP6412924.1 tRNA (N6-isopentenyl adenosine(37)-C2)-methylthiotransferase MiaB [Bacteroidia bacterium]